MLKKSTKQTTQTTTPGLAKWNLRLLDEARGVKMVVMIYQQYVDYYLDIIQIFKVFLSFSRNEKKEMINEIEQKSESFFALHHPDPSLFIKEIIKQFKKKLKMNLKTTEKDEREIRPAETDKEKNTNFNPDENTQTPKKIIVTKNPRKFCNHLAKSLYDGAKLDPDLQFIGDHNTIADIIQRSIVDKDGKSFAISTISQYISNPKEV